MNAARRWLAKKQGVTESEVAPILAGVEIPDPVFFCSIETASLVNIFVTVNINYDVTQNYVTGIPKEIGTSARNASTGRS